VPTDSTFTVALISDWPLPQCLFVLACSASSWEELEGCAANRSAQTTKGRHTILCLVGGDASSSPRVHKHSNYASTSLMFWEEWTWVFVWFV